ncbi:glycoside hydrolase family 32 protein [Larkinella ripae]
MEHSHPVFEPYRPRFHFSPQAQWMNDPNGLVFFNGTYHLFFQYHPHGTTWGPMHWGHATSQDLVLWQELPVALFPDELGWIFSGSAVVDANNTSGFGQNGQVPLVAIFTHHHPKLEEMKSDRHQYQSLAYSLDEGKTWTKYAGNPVLPNPGIADFRDPKVRWYEPHQKWVMALAVKDRIAFYSSPDLKSWSMESEFGSDRGAHGGVWECPDLLPFRHGGREVWVLLVSINPGGPNGGSATQYFVGDFDGKTFTPDSADIRWLDDGPDNYAGVTFANTGERTILMGWMNNWQYANQVPTTLWRGAATVPRELGLTEKNRQLFLTSTPVSELDTLNGQRISLQNLSIQARLPVEVPLKNKTGLWKLELTAPADRDFAIVLSNQQENELVIGYEKAANRFYIDRSRAGKTGFEPGFGKRLTAPRLSPEASLSMTLLIDVASVELFADNGLTAMTAIFFPESVMTRLLLSASENMSIPSLTYTELNP